MRHSEVKHLYKYFALKKSDTKSRERTIKSLKNQEIWFSNPSKFNDPFDCNIRIDNSSSIIHKLLLKIFNYIKENEILKDSKLEKFQYINEYPNNFNLEKLTDEDINALLGLIIHELVKSIKQDDQNLFFYDIEKGIKNDLIWKFTNSISNKFYNTFGVLCLSESAINPLLWAHYSDSHKGFCIEYERSPSNFLGNDNITFPVRYTDEYPMISFDDVLSIFSNGDINNFSIKDFNIENISSIKLDHTFIGSILLTKSDHWSYEKEWRSISKSSTSSNLKIKRIVFGLKMEEEDKEEIYSIFGNTINYAEVEFIPNSFSLKLINSKFNKK